MKFKILTVMTLIMAIVTSTATFHEKSIAPPIGRQDELANKMFMLQETEPTELYLELVDPLDRWTAQAIQNTTQTVSISEQYWNQCQITNSNATVFKYAEKFYTFKGGVSTRRHVIIHVDPSRETGNGVLLTLRLTTYSPEKPYYELLDPLDPWTEAAIQDLINWVEVDDIYLEDCALLKPILSKTAEQRPIFKYHEEYYALGIGFYDSFALKVPIKVLLALSWIVLGVLWLGSGILRLIPHKKEEKVLPPVSSSLC